MGPSTDTTDRGAPAEIRCGYALLCDHVQVVAEKPHYVGVVNRVFAKQFPSVCGQLYLAVELLGPPDGEAVATVELFGDRQGEVVARAPRTKISFSASGGATLHWLLAGLPIGKPGPYEFRVVIDRRVVARRPFVAEYPPRRARA